MMAFGSRQKVAAAIGSLGHLSSGCPKRKSFRLLHDGKFLQRHLFFAVEKNFPPSTRLLFFKAGRLHEGGQQAPHSQRPRQAGVWAGRDPRKLLIAEDIGWKN